MTQDEIIEMARQADLDWHTGWTLDEEAPNRFEAFAKLVAADAAAKKREACAKYIESLYIGDDRLITVMGALGDAIRTMDQQ